jgi:hypothetical protein
MRVPPQFGVVGLNYRNKQLTQHHRLDLGKETSRDWCILWRWSANNVASRAAYFP